MPLKKGSSDKTRSENTAKEIKAGKSKEQVQRKAKAKGKKKCTLEEAKKVASIIETADNGCSVCVYYLVELANKIFPEFIWEYEDYKPIKVKRNEQRYKITK